MNTRFLTITLSLFLILLVIDLARRDKLTFKYASPWILIALTGIFFAAFNVLLFRLSYLLGFHLTSNFVFFTILCCFVFLSLFLTLFLCQQNNRNDQMARKIGILELELQQAKKNFSTHRHEPPRLTSEVNLGG